MTKDDLAELRAEAEASMPLDLSVSLKPAEMLWMLDHLRQDEPTAQPMELARNELESVGWQYKFPSLWGGVVWRDSPNRYNGSDYSETREIFAKRALNRTSKP